MFETINAIKSESPAEISAKANNVLVKINLLIEEKLLLLTKTGNQLFELKNEIETILNNLETDREYRYYHLSNLQEVLSQANQILADCEREINEG